MRSAAARALAAAAIVLSAPSWAAPPEVPAAFVYQGVLTDAGGEPRTGNVDLKLRIYDLGTGGSLLYVQSYSGVALDAGTFSIVIGPTGAATDPPSSPPLTTSLATVFAGDLAATGPQRWLELQVGTSSALARTRLQATPFALRAGSADTADFANEAGSAGSTDSVDGIPAEFVSQLWNHTNFDNSGPPNNDPLEGLADVDGDGSANFVDADNDGDGINDSEEIGTGKHPNLRTPTVLTVTPARGLTFQSTLVTVTAQGLEPSFTPILGPLTLTPQNVTPTSFQASVGPLSAGNRPLAVVNANGQLGQLANAFTHADALAGGGSVDVFGAEQVLLGGAAGTSAGYSVSTDADFVTDVSFPGPGGSFRWDAGGRVAGIACTPVLTCQIRYRRDSDGDFDLADETGTLLESSTTVTLSAPSLVFDGSGRPGGGYVKRLGSGGASPGIPVAFHDRNADGDFADANERTEFATLTTTATQAQADFDPTGRLAYVYGQDAFAMNVVIAYDRNGDGDFADANESTVTAFGAQPQCLGAAFDGNGHLAILHGNTTITTLRRDLNDDADFADAGESSTFLGATSACAIASGPGVDLAVSLNEASRIRLYRDLNGDLDFADADESRLLVTLSTPLSQSLRIVAGARAFIGTVSELAITAP